MSVYSHNMYGQPSYGGSSYSSPPPVPSGYQYYHQPPPHPAQPTYHVDPATFRRDYAARLSELTFNSRPIIQHLSMLAQDNSRFADVVAQCIEAHIRRAPPWMKLPAFYLLDAISKNVYEPYARHFTSFVVPLYLETYTQADENTRNKMEEMLLTWRTGSPSGKELFGIPQQMAIERGVWGGGSTGHPSTSGFHSGSGLITKSQVLSELQFTLGQKERALLANPYDTTSQNHIAVLQQLRKLVEAGVSQEELKQILTQLRNLVKSAPPPPVPQPTLTSNILSWQPQPPPFPPRLPQQAPHSQTYSQPTPTPAASTSDLNTEHQVVSQGFTSPPVTTTGATPANISNLLSTLLKAGVLSTNGTPVGAGSSATEIATTEAVKTKQDASREYRDAIFSRSISFNTIDLARTTPSAVEFLYDRLSSQCKQCGVRFPDTKLGKRDLDDHLDMHFRQNRKANQNVGRGHSRSWFIGLEDWIHDVSGDGKGKGRADGSGPLNSKAAAAAELAKREADLRAQYVIVPPGDEAQSISCPICKESLKSEFLEEDEEWVWKNAIRKDDKLYHATCHAEAVASKSNLVARLRTEKMHGSRSATPEAQPMTGITSTPPLATRIVRSNSPSQTPPSRSKLLGVKRKVEDSDSVALQDDATATPPLKKIALSPTLVPS